MNKVYGIFCGSYSDWRVLGFCSTEEIAKAYCDKANKTHIGEYISDGLYVIELSCLDGVQVTDRYRVAESFVFCKENGEWCCYDGDIDTTEVYDNRQNKVTEREDGSIEITVYISPDDKYTDKSEKIARDELFKYLAQKEC